MAPRPTGPPILGVGVPSTACCAVHNPPPEPWIELHAEAVGRFRYPTWCLTHECPGHPHKGPLYMALHAPQALPSEWGPALRTHSREHFGVHAML